MFNFLLGKGAKLTIGQAAAYGELSLVQSMVEQDPDLVNFSTHEPIERWSPLWTSAFWKRQETVAYLLARGATVNAPTRQGETPLHGAVMGGDRAIVERLLLTGANVNAQADNGMTPLHLAAWNRSTDLVSLLLAHGADKRMKDNNGFTPLQLATTEEGVLIEGWGKAKAPIVEIVTLLQNGKN